MTINDDLREEVIRLRAKNDYIMKGLGEFKTKRNKIEEEGTPTFGKGGTKFYNYDGAIYCVGANFIIQTGGVGLALGKFRFFGVEPYQVYFDLADVPDLFDFVDTYRKVKEREQILPDQNKRKLVALIPTAGKTKEQIAKEFKAILRKKGILLKRGSRSSEKR